ncbi:ubiquitin fusion degradation protein UFD1-domain-containing protein [Dissophora ornata]|nr:hypothetical protein BGZ58_007002 [Dissophora ornata]KAI8605792.1 ubiquitin fusion degradation protein UFD1-domain-containing protein [Dissophora ornata]
MSFFWSSTFTVGPAASNSKGDKIILPQRALESIIQAHSASPSSPIQPNGDNEPSWDSRAQDGHNQSHSGKSQELPSPLTFQIRNPANRLLTHGGVKEFSAAEGQVRLPAWMMSSLSLSEGDQVMVKYMPLLKGVWAKFRPLSPDYMEILNFRALLEAALRTNYTTLTRGEVLKVHQGAKEFGFVVEELKPEPGLAVCITDTDLEVDIEPLDTDMPGVETSVGSHIYSNGSQAGGIPTNDRSLRIGGESQGNVVVGEYQRWTINVPNRRSGLSIRVNVQEPGDVDVLVSTVAPVSLLDHYWADFTSLNPRTIVIPANDQEYGKQQDSHEIYISVYGRASSAPVSTSSSPTGTVAYSVLAQYHDSEESALSASSTVSSSPLTTAFTEDIPNKGVAGYQECSNCNFWILERTMMLHTNFCFRNNAKCDRCGDVMKKEELVNHFHCDHCDKGAPASNARDRIRGLSSHESYCGDRTIQCQKCSQMVSLKDVQVHAENHEYQRQNQAAPQLCSNQNCVREKSTNVLGLCQRCFGPYWVPTEDPKNQKLVQRLARNYHSQLMVGCKNKWCRNLYCATFRGQEMDATTAATEMMSILKEAKVGSSEGGKTWLCVDEGTTKKKVMAELLFESVKEHYAFGWCVKAMEAEKTDIEAANKWLNLNAPKKFF